MVTIDTALLRYSVASVPMPGETHSGDLHLVKDFPEGVLAAVVDGLGHGQAAAAAAETAVATLEQRPHESVLMLVNRCNRSLRGMRGAVMSLASFSARDSTMTWVGVGNVRGVLLRADRTKVPAREILFPNNGVVGGKPLTLRASILVVHPGDTLIFATDGIAESFAHDLIPEGSPPQMIERILSGSTLGTDDALVLVARYVGKET
jgi:phosphoserine phosphatase RsbX